MPTATVEVAYVNEPKPGKKMGSIKTKDGTYYGVWPDKLGLFQPGETYRIIYTTNESGFHNFKSMAADGAPAKANGAAPAKGAQTQSVEMAAMGFVGRWLEGAGNSGMEFPDVNRLAEMVTAAKNAWEIAFSNKKPGDPDDEIPF